MKKIILLAFVMFSAFLSHAQLAPQKILGTWTLIKYNMGPDSIGDQTKAKFRRIRTFTNTHFIDLEYDTSGTVITKTWRGYYYLKSSSNTKKISPDSTSMEMHVSSTSKTAYGKHTSQYYSISVDKEGFLHTSTTRTYFPKVPKYTVAWEDGIKAEETWMPVPERPQSYDGGKGESVFNEKVFLPNAKAILVIKTGKKDYIIKQTTKDPKPLNFIRYGNISYIKVINDEVGLQRYGTQARFGVVEVAPTEASVDVVVAKLRAQKNIED